MDPKKVIACDLDGTLAQSKSPLTTEMAEVINELLSKYFFAVISGGNFAQFQKQFLPGIVVSDERIKNLYLFPTMGTACYTFDEKKSDWSRLYYEPLGEEERGKIIKAFEDLIKENKLDHVQTYGEIIEDRGTQVTFSALGQQAPVSEKEKWDSDQKKRTEFVEFLKKKIPEFEISIGGATSIDVTKKGLDKAYAIGKIKEIMKVGDNDIVFIGDALYKGGNDSAVKKTAVDYIQEDGPAETLELLRRYARLL